MTYFSDYDPGLGKEPSFPGWIEKPGSKISRPGRPARCRALLRLTTNFIIFKQKNFMIQLRYKLHVVHVVM